MTALIHGRIDVGKRDLSNSALTKLWIEKGYAVLADSEQKEAWRNTDIAGGEPSPSLSGHEPASHSGSTSPATPVPKTRKRVNTSNRTQELHETARRLTQRRADAKRKGRR